MNWRKWLGYNLYKKLWSLIGSRPWTYIMRDFAYQNPFLVLLLGFFAGITLYSFLEWRDLIIGSTFFLLAHLFWGTKYRRNQQGR